MRKTRITVLRREFYDDLAREYAHPKLGRCDLFEDGQVFITEFQKPDNFCDEAWKAIQHYVFALSCGATEIFDGGWVRHPNVSINCCNDGVRPVIFKIEAIEE